MIGRILDTWRRRRRAHQEDRRYWRACRAGQVTPDMVTAALERQRLRGAR